MSQTRTISHARVLSIDSEMHELHQEADFLDQKMTIVPAGINGDDSRMQRHNADPDAQAMVIDSLRAQVQDLFAQVSQLNNKLVSSYDRVSGLEDELHVSATNLRSQTLKISELELERSQHISALSTGLLVEKDHVTTELTRLMEKATEEAAQRGQAESARAEIEKDLDDLSANLFNQANMMVAEARIAQARSERKATDTERALREAEEVVGALQSQMQTLETEKGEADRRVEVMRVTMGKGKWVQRSASGSAGPRLLCSHLPYQEYLALIAHLRTIRPSTLQPPGMSTLLTLPFLARLVSEDSDPTVRLDLAPSLNWLTRRSVISAIHSGQLTVEPMSTSALLEELSPSGGPSNGHTSNPCCALCGSHIFPPANAAHGGSGLHPPGSLSYVPQGSWSSSIFKNSIVQSISTAPTNLTNLRPHSPSTWTPQPSEMPTHVYIFRLDTSSSTGLPVNSTAQNRASTVYPLCTSNWCLLRLRSTCSLWAFVRTCIVEKVWEEGSYVPPQSPTRTSGKYQLTNGYTDADKPPVPPRRARMGIGALWGTMQRSLSSSGGSREIEKDVLKTPSPSEKPDEKRALPPLPPPPPPRAPNRKFVPPPVHPSLSSPARTTASLPSTPPRTPPAAAAPPLPPRRQRAGQGLSISSVPEAEERPTVRTDDLEPPQNSDEHPVDALEIPSAITRNESQDQFATPTEGPESFISRSGSPSTIPLPPSVSPSPSPEDGAAAASSETASAPSDSAVEPPTADSAEPTVPEPEPAATEDQPESEPPAAEAPSTPQIAPADNAPVVAGSPVPPPLPRRAAARARTQSVAPRPVPAPPPAVNAESKDDAEKLAPVEAPAEPAAVDASEKAEKAVEGVDAGVVAEDTISSAEPVPSGEPSDAVTPPSEDTKSSAASSAAGSLDLKREADDADSHAGGRHSPVVFSNGATFSVESLAGPAETGVSDLKDASDEEPEADAQVPEIDTGLYVGDVTWEERTWKELVRLREDMFWARIGGAR